MPPSPYASESEHWYYPDGRPAYTVTAKNGEPRPTTLRDARKMGLYPSVTKIMGIAAKPGLEKWKAQQLLLAALTLPKKPDEPEDAWITRVWNDSREQGRKAAERGSAIHGAIEAFMRGDEIETAMEPYVQAVMDAIAPLKQAWLPEKSFGYALGFGGKVDLHSPEIVLDYKSKEGDLSKLECYDDNYMQVAAYARGLLRPNAGCGIVFIGRDLPARARLVMHTRAETQRGWLMFHRLLEYWQAASDYWPTLENQREGIA
jgi:hypothetical protein